MRIEPPASLAADDPRYVLPPHAAGARLADLIGRGLTPIAVAGHRGLGKSTELRRALAELPEAQPGMWVDVGALAMPADPDRVLYDIATAALQHWVQSGPEQQPSVFLVEDMRASDPSFPQGRGRTLKPSEICLAAFDEMVGAYGVERIVLLIDGVDTLPSPVARAVMMRLLDLRTFVEVVVVTSHGAVTGPDAVHVLEHYRLMAVSPVDVHLEEGVRFLGACALAFVQSLSDEPVEVGEYVLDQAALESGGVLSTALCLVRDAVGYSDGEVGQEALDQAIGDQVERVRRLLCAGDRDVLQAAHGTRGLEVPSDRRARLLDQGLLLEYGVGEGATCRRSPAVARLLGDGATC